MADKPLSTIAKQVQLGLGLSEETVLPAAMLDRLLRHSTVIQIGGESYRLKYKRRAGMVAKPKERL
jgi:DNA replication protein DnaC